MSARPTVLVTRPEADETLRLLQGMGWTAVLAPALRITSRDMRLTQTFEPQAVLVSSGNALAALPVWLRGTTLLAVGDATASRASALGFARVQSAGGDAGDLARLAATLDPAAGPLLLACGAGQGRPLAATLRESGFRVWRRVVYAANAEPTLPAAARLALRESAVDAALFFSAASARATIAQFRRAGLLAAARDITACAISPAVAAALSPLPWRSIRVASRPDQHGVLACLTALPPRLTPPCRPDRRASGRLPSGQH